MNKLTISLFISGLSLIPVIAIASSVQFGRVVDIKGSGFISYEGKTHEIKKGEVINVNSELIVESSGQVTFTDNADHRFFLGSSSTAAVFAGKVELRSGDIWMQSLNKMDDYKLVSANAMVNYQGGEAIFSYDSVKGKTQLMVINGLMKFSNLRSPELNLTVSEGNFSFVDPSFDEGMPRDPTPVGEKSYKSLVSMFPGVAPMDKHSAEIFKDKNREDSHAERKVASVSDSHGATPEKTQILPAAQIQTANELEKEYKSEVLNLKQESKNAMRVTKTHKKTLTKTATQKSSKTIVSIYGLKGLDTSATTAIYDIKAAEILANTEVSTKGRGPASVSSTGPTGTVLDQAVPKADSLNVIPSTPQYKESEKLIEKLNKL